MRAIVESNFPATGGAAVLAAFRNDVEIPDFVVRAEDTQGSGARVWVLGFTV